MGWDEFDQGIAPAAASLPVGEEIPFGKQIEQLFARQIPEREAALDGLLGLAATTQARIDAGDDVSKWWMLNEGTVRQLIRDALGLPGDVSAPEYLVALADALR